MESWDDRGQSIQIGAVILFAALILLLSLYQATVVPQQNEQVEFDHSQQVQSDLLDLRNAVTSMFGESASRSVSIRLGTSYPSRVLAVNPPPVSGSLRTDGTAESGVYFGLANAVALDRETDDFWNGTGPLREYSTGAVVYRPSYNEYGQPPRTVYDSTVLYDNFTFEGATIAHSDQTLIDGSTISLVALNGSLQRSSSGSTAVDVRPVSASSTTVTVENKDAELITIRTATRLPNSTWTELLADESNVTGWETSALTGVDGFRMLEVELKPGTYELRMAKAGVGTRVNRTEPAYLTGVRGNGSTVPENGSQRFVVELRDRYNNPVPGEPVTANASWIEGAPATERTGNDGRASFVYRVPEDAGGRTERVNVSIGRGAPPAAFRGGAPENVSLNVSVVDTDVTGTGTGSGDGQGPDVTGQTASPDPVDQGAQVTLSGRVSDIERGGLDIIAAEWFRAAPGETVAGQDPGNGSANSLSPADGSWDQAFEDVTDTTTASWQTGTHTIAFRGEDANGNWGPIRTTTVSVVANSLITAVEPDPQRLPDDEGEFVRLDIPSGVDTSGWVLADGDGNSVTLSNLDGTVYFARDPGAFADQWNGVSAGDVEGFDFALNNDGDAVELRDSTGTVVDRFAYEGPTFDDGSSFDFGATDYEGQVAYRTQNGGSYVDTDSASDWAERGECDFFGGGDGCGPSGGFERATATALLPNTGQQQQTFTFTPDSTIPSGTQIEINLDDPQQLSPLQVDYSNYNFIDANISTSNTNGNTNGDTGFIMIEPTDDIAAGQTVQVRTAPIKTGGDGQYDVTVTRRDTSASTTTSFDVSNSAGDAEISNFEASDLQPDTDGQQQTFTFTLDSALSGDDRINIGLSDAQGSSDVQYQGSVTVNFSQSNKNLNSGSDGTWILIEPPSGGLPAGTGVEVTINTNTDELTNAPYEVGITRGDADTTSTTFGTAPPPTPNQAYVDQDGDEVYEPSDGDFTVDLAAEGYDYQSPASLVVPEGVPLDAGSLTLRGDNLTIRSDITTDYEMTLRATQGDLDASGIAITPGGAVDVRAPSGEVDLSGATLDNTAGSSDVTVRGDTLDLRNAEVIAAQGLTLNGGAIELGGATLDNTAGSSNIVLTGAGATGTGIEFRTSGSITASDLTSVDFADATFDASGSITLGGSSTTAVTLTDSTLDTGSSGDVAITGESVTLRNVDATGYGGVAVDATNGDLAVDDSSFSGTASYASVPLSATGVTDVRDTTVVSGGGGGGTASVSGGTTTLRNVTATTYGGFDATATSGALDVGGSSLEATVSYGSISLTTNAEMNLTEARLAADGSLTGDRPSGNSQVTVTDAHFVDTAGNGRDFDIEPGNTGGPPGDPNPPNGVVGEPDQGQVV
ncbi:hypothetical protein [Halosimplex marinum]|uniref:hypothetical protein n=1 Tax=Halosimplex marinum TaxID=3396620 RepID=UPI003F57C106